MVIVMMEDVSVLMDLMDQLVTFVRYYISFLWYVLLNVPQSLNTAPGPACNGSYCWNNGTCDSDTDTCICTERFTGPECRREICEFML